MNVVESKGYDTFYPDVNMTERNGYGIFFLQVPVCQQHDCNDRLFDPRTADQLYRIFQQGDNTMEREGSIGSFSKEKT